MGAIATRMTADEYYAATVVGDRKQLVEGEIVVYGRPPIHGLLQGRVLYALGTWADAEAGRGCSLPPTDVRLNDRNVWGPDVIWFADEHVPTNGDGYPDRIPDLCVEIRSHGIWAYDVGPKKRVYETGGLPELWLVDDESESVLVYRRSTPKAETFDVALELGSGDELTSPQLPGFALSLDELFAR
jgi:Uma2 family endonuclease